MTDPTSVLSELLDGHPAAPFLFIGSGFSRRYLGLETWSGLLERFCKTIKPFGYYSTSANGDLPQAASLMARDFNDWWWQSEDTRASREKYGHLVQNQSDALKLEIGLYLDQFSRKSAIDAGHEEEISILSDIAIDGIITTNWDHLLEDIFPDYKVFIGQEELLFSNPQSIGEIYKIHGSASAPSSLVLTSEDYAQFTAKNPYLAAKLVTIFVEHPIVFLGYSIADPHIQNIIMSIARCLSQDKVKNFEDNLIFVQRTKSDEQPSIQKSTIQADGFTVTMMIVTVSDFGQVYRALAGRKRKIPARLLRFFKEQMYEFVRSPDDKSTKLAVVDYDRLSEADDIEFVVGVGVAQEKENAAKGLEKITSSAMARRGYEGVTAQDIFEDCIREQSEFDASNLLEAAYPIIARQSRTFLPIYRYLKSAGIENNDQLSQSKFEGAKKIITKMRGNSLATTSYRNRYDRSYTGLSTDEIINTAGNARDALLMLPFQRAEDVDVERLRHFLIENVNAFNGEPYATAFKKLVCHYDKIAFGFD
ncbi:SIR2 family protein [Sphingomonas sp. 2378]|uniref:SIR2 family protein n=1 Tax=Sphingomonas sp. 2378 TaxID=1219748 RepID=UPI00311AF59B